MAILNVTPDSFSDGGLLDSIASAVSAAKEAVASGADMLDIGGESTRPGAAPVSVNEQIKRVIPVVRAIREAGMSVPISVDTTRAAVADAALREGATVINDVSAGLDDDEMLPLAAQADCGVILMHRLRKPQEDQYSHELTTPPDYGGDVVAVVGDFLMARVQAATAAGVNAANIAIDPGLGFGKTVAQNFELIRRTNELVRLGRPVVAAASRKSFLGAASGVEAPTRRVAASVAASVIQRWGGATIFRAHDVKPHREALDVADAAIGPCRDWSR